MAIELLCRKIGMTRIFVETGEAIPVTVLEAEPNTVVQVKTPEKDGYSAIQLGMGARRARTLSKAALGHLTKNGGAPKRHLHESRLTDDEVAQYEAGQELKADLFEAGQRVDVIGTSKGCGTQGTVKRHNFKVKRRTHGTHEAFRHPGSIGAGSYPGKVIKGMKMFGRMGNERVTTRNLEVVRVDTEKNLVLIRGAVPGHNNAVVRIRSALAPK